MNEEELFYQLAITQVKGIGPRIAKRLINKTRSAKKVFTTSVDELNTLSGVTEKNIKAIQRFKEFKRIEKELSFITKHNISTRFFLDESYPFRLKFCNDAPILLFGIGNLNWNPTRSLSIVGTRRSSLYGETQVNKIIDELAASNPTIVSGMAYGVDIHAHRAAVKNDLSSIAVVAHGLDRLYPAVHRNTLHKMIDNGGMVSEFISGTIPDRENFPKRNRIIAGLSDATLVIESAKKGGSMITADIAASYNRDVFALPGNIGSEMSEGCNYLIHTQKAGLIRNAADIIKIMNWNDAKAKKQVQRSLFIELNDEEQKLIQVLHDKGTIGIDELSITCSYTMSKTAVILLNLEFKGLVIGLPGKVYKLA